MSSAQYIEPMTEAQQTATGQLFDELLGEQQEPTNTLADNTDQDNTEEATNADSLPPEAKKALVFLYRHGSVLMEHNKERYDILCQHEAFIRQHMADVYMEVVFDRYSGHIFTQITTPDEDEEEPARLISAKPLSLYQSILTVVLRKYYQDRETAGEQTIIIDLERLASFLVPYLPISHSDRKDQDKLKKAVSSLVDKRLLIKMRGEQDRYQISPIIRNVVNADFLESLLDEYKKLLSQEQQDPRDHEDG